jgi:antitoxin (DNA-binding transcriptional repressor) of toxin-antitoxin stability system
MATPITQRELRNDSGAIMRRLEAGERFLVTRNGVPVGELTPLRRRLFVATEVALAAFEGAPAIDGRRLRGDLDRFLDDDDVTPRA